MNRPDQPLDLDAIEARANVRATLHPLERIASMRSDIYALSAEVKRLRGMLGDCGDCEPQPEHEHEWQFDRTICGFCGGNHGYCTECGETEPCDTPQPDPLDESDKREQQCLVSKSCTGPHEWWYTESGGGHQLEGVPDPRDLVTERGLTRYRCPGPREVMQAPEPDPLDESDHRDRLDCEGDRWFWAGGGDWRCTERGGTSHGPIPLAEVPEYTGGPLTFADDPQTPQDAQNQPQTVLGGGRWAEVADAYARLARALSGLPSGDDR